MVAIPHDHSPPFTNFRRLVRVIRADGTTMTFGAIYVTIGVLTILAYPATNLPGQEIVVFRKIADTIGLAEDGGFAEILSYGAAVVAAANFLIPYLEQRDRCLLFLVLPTSFIGIATVSVGLARNADRYYDHFG